MLKISCLVTQHAGLIWQAHRARSCDPHEQCPHPSRLRFVLTPVYFDKPEGAQWGNTSTEVSKRHVYAMQRDTEAGCLGRCWHEPAQPSRGMAWPKLAPRRWQYFVATLPCECRNCIHLFYVVSGTKAELTLLSLFSLERKQEGRKWMKHRHIAIYLTGSEEFRKKTC